MQRIMKYLALVALAATAMAIETATEAATKDLLAENFAHFLGMKQSEAEVCTRRWNTTNGDAYYIQQVYDRERENDNPVLSKRISCALHCCFEMQGLISDGDIQVAKFYNISNDVAIPLGVNLHHTLYTCNEQVKHISEKCLLSFEYGKCVIRGLYGL